MRTWKSICLSVAMAMGLYSCDWLHHDCNPELNFYQLALHFQDASGNDLTEGIELELWTQGVDMEDAQWGKIASDLYALNIIPSNYRDGETLDGPDKYPARYKSDLEMNKFDNVGYCVTNTFSRSKSDNDVRKLTYRFRCPYIFGDNEEHEFVAYWELNPNSIEDRYYAECYRIEYDGKEVVPQPVEGYQYMGIIALDKSQN